ncbi:MAG: hypothetical protein OXF50_09530, partial [Caldilineaceae bacterium]|nr:hypothetical protein [Caldilineaceae bacterium]
MHSRFGVGVGRHKACPYWDLMGLEVVVWRNSFDWAHVTNVHIWSSRHVVGPGALRGRSPRT